jgi:hypothetical protein
MNQLNKSIADIPLPDRLKNRPISSKGYPVPWFVTLKDTAGEWEFRVIDPARVMKAQRMNLCSICGQQLGVYKTFAIGPMCTVNRISSEAPVHLECGRYAVRACPFMINPRMRRNTAGMSDMTDSTTPGEMIERNPGVTCLWTTKEYTVIQPDQNKGILFRIGNPTAIEWWSEGRGAMYTEVINSVESGLPFLRTAAKKEGEAAERELEKMIRKAQPFFRVVV